MRVMLVHNPHNLITQMWVVGFRIKKIDPICYQYLLFIASFDLKDKSPLAPFIKTLAQLPTPKLPLPSNRPLRSKLYIFPQLLSPSGPFPSIISFRRTGGRSPQRARSPSPNGTPKPLCPVEVLSSLSQRTKSSALICPLHCSLGNSTPSGAFSDVVWQLFFSLLLLLLLLI